MPARPTRCATSRRATHWSGSSPRSAATKPISIAAERGTLSREIAPGRRSKLNLFEAFVDNIITLAQSNKEQWVETAIFVTFDEGGGYYDSGFIQPVDFFGTGPRIPMIAVSRFSRGGRIVHSYTEHSSFVKFVERNWHLGRLSDRSRDNLPNPRADDDNPYVPVNMPAIGDLFDMFDFDRDRDDHDRGHDDER
jgi:phospholipase C